ncbi:class I SAM-dependent methyltransferase [Pyrolobus fumarii]|uniref:class I SAM-dependent methyltransferase n=1 Tax=Pyrolobus fumarii TaxID=54252 RepID=UPI000AACC074|nr:class I SAM-dependent methyltransferase [Pyrolobus fumarii]
MDRPEVRVFDEYWARYDEWYERNRVLYESEVRAVAKALEGSETLRAVEVGVGTGRFAARLGVLLGIDPSLSMLGLAKRRGVDVVQGVGETLPLRGNSLDVVLLVVTLCFVREPQRVLTEAARVARKVVACIVPRDSPWGVMYKTRLSRNPFYKYARFYTVGEVAAIMKGAGLSVERCVSTLYTNPPGPRDVEEPRLECSERAGFVCIVGTHR